MAKKLALTILTLTLALFISGCSSVFEKEYVVVSEYRGEPTGDSGGAAVEVRSSYALKSAVTNLVANHAGHGVLEFKNYDGDISSDLAEALWAVKSETAYGAYAVYYISYDISHIVSYYTADIYITYRHTRAEMDSIQSATEQNIAPLIEAALEESRDKALFMMNGSQIKADALRDSVYEAYYSNPLLCATLPDVRVSAYPENGFQRIFEISLDYGRSGVELAEMKRELKEAAETIASGLDGGSAYYAALDACRTLSEICAYNDGDEVTAGSGGESSTAYGALVGNTANSEGFAMAYKALCDALGVDCRVVSGRLDKAQHAWNIVSLNGNYYHVDVSQLGRFGLSSVFLRDDSAMWGRYWWDIEKYPACETVFGQAGAEWREADEDASGQSGLPGEIGS